VKRSLTMLAAAAALLSGCGDRGGDPRPGQDAPLPPQAPGVGRGPDFRPPSLGARAARGLPVEGLRCSRSRQARFGAHLELFAAGRVVLVAPGIGIAPPRIRRGAYVSGGRCSYPVRTREPTGVLEVERGTAISLGQMFAVWGRPLSRARMAGFRGRVRAYVGGRRWRRDPRAIPLTRHAQIVLEVGPHVSPHASYRFPPGL
jgi:hypothetical protein